MTDTPQPLTWLYPHKRSGAAHLFVNGAGQRDTSLCGVALVGDGIVPLNNHIRCKRCERAAGVSS